MLDDEQHDQAEEAGREIVQHNAPATGQRLQLADRPWFGDVKETKQRKREDGMRPVRFADNQREPLAGDFVDNHVAGVFTAGFLRDASCCGVSRG